MPDIPQNRPSAAVAYRDFFAQADTVIEQFHHRIDRDIPTDGTWWGIVQLAILVRAFNQYRSIVNLLRENHWEDALILVRSLFELLLNTEELCRHPDRIEEAAESFVAFAHLQRYLRWREVELYNITTGRAGKEARTRIDETDRQAKKFFALFWYADKKGQGKWRATWSRKNAAELCRLSANPLREHHYRLLYGRGSEFTHSAPVAVFATMQLKHEPEELADTIRDVDAREERELREIGSMATVFLLEIAVLIGGRLPGFDIKWCLDVGMPSVGRMLAVPDSVATSMRASFIAWLETKNDNQQQR